MQSWPELDVCLMRYPCDTCFEGISSEIISNLLHGKFRANLDGPLCRNLFSSLKPDGCLENNFKTNIEEKLFGGKDLTKCYEVLTIGISSLQLFVQVNWTGPLDDTKYDPPLQLLRKSLSSSEDCPESEWAERLMAELVLDGEDISSNICNLELLLFARAVLNANVFDDIVSAKWWRMRCLFIHQQVLEERSPSIHTQLCTLLEELSSCESLSASSELSVQLQLEAACIWLHYGHINQADQSIKTAYKILGLDVTLVGALGKRTRYQEKEIAQLTLSVKVNRDDDSVSRLVVPEAVHFPKDVKLEDDVRLSQISFSDSAIGQFPLLTAAEQAAIMASCMYKRKSQPRDKLILEEALPYVNCLTAQPRVWALQASALFTRSQLDTEHRRTVGRALTQFQNLTDSVADAEPSAVCRLAWMYCSYLPPAWRLQALLAQTYACMGMVETALDIFLSIKLWDKVINCYNLLKLRHKAAEVICQELQKKPSVKLLCLLGDATDDVDCYRQAWELSEKRSGQAQRHWANYYFSRKEYAKSIPHLELSLSLNSLQTLLWFRLGYAALDQENWPLCATAYRRFCSLEPESFEGWNNLAKAYVKTGQKIRAYRALQEAVRCNYENWRVWDNLMAVSTDCGQFDEVIRSYHRILDLNEKHVDLEVLKILTNVVVRELVTSKDCCPIAKLRKLTLTLFGRLTAQVLTNSTLWQLYAQVAASDVPTPENRTKVAQCLQKAYRAATQGSWERDIHTCQQVIDLCVDLAKAYVQCSTQCGSPTETIQMLSSAKLPLKSVLVKIEKEQTDLITGELPVDLSIRYKELLSHYELIADEIQRLHPSS